MEKTCLICNNTFITTDKRNKYCSRECYYESRKNKSWGGALYKGKGSRGKYSDYQVNRMVEGKKENYIKRMLQKIEEGFYNIDYIDEVLNECYIDSISCLSTFLKMHSRYREITCLINYYNWEDRFCKVHVPECYRVMNPEQCRWFRQLLTDSEDYFDFMAKFKNTYKNVGVRQAACKYNNLLSFVQETKFETRVLNKNLTKNYGKHGSSCELLVRNILKDLDVNFQEQVLIKTDWNAYIRPDFIIDKKLIIEVNGDYWHAFNLREDEMTEQQLERKLKDLRKYNFYKSNDYHYMIIWEHELVNIDSVKNRIIKEIESNEVNNRKIIY